MRIVWFQGSLRHHNERGKIFAAGMKRHGIDVSFSKRNSHLDCDLAVFWSHKLHEVINRQRRASRDYLVMEAGYVGDRMKGFWSLGFNGLNGRADFCNADCGTDRWLKYFPDKLQPWRKEGGEYIVILGQVRGDESVRNVDLRAHYERWAHIIRVRFTEPVVFRAHPQDPNLSVNGLRSVAGSLEEVLAKARFTVTWNSNSAVDSILAGVPTVVFDHGSMAYQIAGHDLLVPPPMRWRNGWAGRLAYAQWTPAEIESGEAWAHLSQRYKDQAA